MARQILMTRKGFALVPWDAVAQDDLEELPLGKPVMVSAQVKRSLPHNRLYWACIRSICQTGGFTDGEGILHDVTKMGAGCFKVIQLSGLTYRVPDSTAFDKMDQADFNEYFRRALSFWESEGLAQWISPDLREKIGVQFAERIAA